MILKISLLIKIILLSYSNIWHRSYRLYNKRTYSKTNISYYHMLSIVTFKSLIISKELKLLDRILLDLFGLS